MEVKEHRLYGKNVEYVEATSYGKNKLIVPDTIIIHYTAGPSGPATVRYFSRSNAKLSAHIVAHEDGKITQMVPFDRKGYHAGRSQYDGRTGFNAFSIGIEISNPGYLVKNPKGDGFVTWWEKKKSNPKTVDPSMVFEGKHRNSVTTAKYWFKYTQEQIDAVTETCKAIAAMYDIKYVLGHEEIAPGRKTDPGPAYPLDKLRDEIFTKEPMPIAKVFSIAINPTNIVKSGIVKAKLNFRKGPSVETDKLTDPIPKNSTVGIISEKDEWIQIAHKIKGWVDQDNLEHDNSDDSGDGIVSSEKIIIRTKPDEKAGLVKNPLTKGGKIYIHDKKDDWVLISAHINGWLMKKYINMI